MYSLNDRFRRIEGTRHVLLMNEDDMRERGLDDGVMVKAETISHDGKARVMPGLAVRRYAVPRGMVAGYYPELNVLLPLWHHAKASGVPAAKAIPVRVSIDSA